MEYILLKSLLMCQARRIGSFFFCALILGACSDGDPGSVADGRATRVGGEATDGASVPKDPSRAEAEPVVDDAEPGADRAELNATLPALEDGELGPSGEARALGAGESSGSGGSASTMGSTFSDSDAASGDPPPGATADPPPASASDGADSDSSTGEGVAATPISSVDTTDPVEPVVPEPLPAYDPGSLTAGAWDDNANFSRFLDYRSDLSQGEVAGMPPWTLRQHEAANGLWADAQRKRQVLDIALVIDTTGSMGDELDYLQQEFLALASTIEDTYAGAEQRWSLVLYKDEGDQYLVRWYDFTKDIAEFRENLAAQSFGGGGDFPEAPDQALNIAAQLGWRTSEEAGRLLFWVADAPHHPEKAAEMASAVEAMQGLDVHVYPVASSGIDEVTEFTMRASAQLTLGRYLFLTDDSGYGNSHKEPSIPCYYVTALDAAILRMVDLEMTGELTLPEDELIVRAVGQPKNGVCELESGAALAL